MTRLLATGCVALMALACGLPQSRPTTRPHQPKPTPPPVVVQFTLDGGPIAGSARVGARSHLRVVFSRQVPPAAVTVALDDRALGADALAWSPDLLSAEVSLAPVVPYHPARLTVRAPDVAGDPAPLQVTAVATVPANAGTGVQPGFVPRTPIAIVVENSGPARPQSGLQDADIVYEYLSEYSTTRMTAIYFARIPEQVGPVRSCRMVNAYLATAFSAVTMCTGVSDGTGGWLFGTTPGSRGVPVLIEPRDRGGHFYRVGFRAIPHNAYTSGEAAGRLRTEASQPDGQYLVDPPHDDVAAGVPADAPSVPLHDVGYSYDAGARQYLRFDHGVPFSDRVTGRQVQAKTVVLLHVPFHDAGWVEDDNGGAHSVWYDMLGSGPAEVYSNGQVVRATWHMGEAGQAYFDNHAPVWFTDEAGRPLLLNTGLTWVHVLGNGQERCPTSPSGCG